MPVAAPNGPDVIHEGELVTIGALEAQTRGEIDIQISTAKRFPRSITKAIQDATSLATLTEEVAESMFYALPRDGKTIEGPSARLAEVVASCWGHMRSEARVVAEDDKFVTSRGTSWDLERNVAVAFEVRRRVTGKSGKKFNDDMVGVASNAASAIAYRNSVLKVIPKAFWWPVYLAARKAAVGDAQTLVAKRDAMLAYFQKMGVPADRVFGVIGVRGIDDVTLEHLAALKGIATAIKDGDTSVDEAFPSSPKEPQRVASETKPPASETSAPAVDTKPESTETAAPASNTAGDLVERAVLVKDTAYIAAGGGKAQRWEVTTDKGTYIVLDEALSKEFDSCAGTDHRFAITYKLVNSSKGAARVAMMLALDEDGGDQ